MVEKKVEKTEKTETAKVKTVAELKQELLEAKRGLYEGTLQNPHRIKALRKEIAKALTLINQGKGA